MSESHIGLNVDGAGKKVRTLKRTVGADEVHEEVHNVTDGSGAIVDPRKGLEVTSSALPAGAATQATLAEVKAKTDNLDVALSTRLKPADLNLDVDKDLQVDVKTCALPSGASTEATLATVAKEAGGNLAAIAGKDFATQTTLALVKAKTDNLDAAISTRALEAGGNLAALAAKDFATQTTLALVKAKTDNIPAKGQETMANSTPVTIASDQTPVPVGDGRPYKRANGSAGTSGNNTIVTAVTGKKIKVYDYSLQAQGTVTATFQSGAGGTAISQPWKLQDREGKNKHGVPPGAPHDLETAAGALLNLSLTATITVGYEVVYTDSDST